MTPEELAALGKNAARFGRIFARIVAELEIEGWSREQAETEARKRAMTEAIYGRGE